MSSTNCGTINVTGSTDSQPDEPVNDPIQYPDFGDGEEGGLSTPVLIGGGTLGLGVLLAASSSNNDQEKMR